MESERFIQSDQDTINDLGKISVDLFFLSNNQKESVFLEKNRDNPDENQASLEKDIFPDDEYTIKEKDVDFDININKDGFDCQFLRV